MPSRLLSREPASRPVALLSLDEWNRMQEMLLLIRSPANRDRLDRAIRDADAGRAMEHELAGE